jgi:hypothetical protein
MVTLLKSSWKNEAGTFLKGYAENGDFDINNF